MLQSEEIAELAAALALAQAEIESAERTATNPHFGKRYSTLDSIWEACREPLTKNGLSVVQLPERVDGGFLPITTLLLHSSGQFIGETTTIPLPQMSPQAFGSALTYGRRYGLSSIVGVAPDDDDAEAAQPQPSHGKPAPAQQQRPPAQQGGGDVKAAMVEFKNAAKAKGWEHRVTDLTSVEAWVKQLYPGIFTQKPDVKTWTAQDWRKLIGFIPDQPAPAKTNGAPANDTKAAIKEFRSAAIAAGFEQWVSSMEAVAEWALTIAPDLVNQNPNLDSWTADEWRAMIEFIPKDDPFADEAPPADEVVEEESPFGPDQPMTAEETAGAEKARAKRTKQPADAASV